MEKSIQSLDLDEIRTKIDELSSELPEKASQFALEKLEFSTKEEVLKIKTLMRENQEDIDKQSRAI